MRIKQRDASDCGAACLASVCAYYKLYMPVSRIRQYTDADQRGATVWGLTQAAARLGFQARGVRAPSSSLKEIPLPAIAHVMVNETTAHYITICKVGNAKMVVMDPASGAFKKMTITAFNKIWSGVIVLLVPEGSFTKRDERISNIHRFWKLTLPHQSVMIQSCIGAAVISLLALASSVYVQKIVDFVLPEQNLRLLNAMTLIMILLLVFQVIIGIIKSLLTLQTGQYIDARLIMGYYRHLLCLPHRFFDNMRVGEITSRINDAVKIRVFISEVVINLIVNALILVFSFLLMFFYYWKLALMMASILPVYALLCYMNDRVNKKWQRKIMEDGAALDAQLVESLQSASTIKKLGLESYAGDKTENKLMQLLRTICKESAYQIYLVNSAESVTRFFSILILWSGSYFVIARHLSPGELLSFFSIISYFTAPAIQLLHANKSIREALIAADRLFEIIDLESEYSGNVSVNDDKSIQGDIRFKNVHFCYGHSENIFSGLNMVIPKGAITGITGSSGSGKSTLACLLQNMYPLKEGLISFNGVDIQYIDKHLLRKSVAVIPQQTDLFSGTILENIAIGHEEPDMKKILDISARLGITGFIEKLPNGFYTILTEQGANLSGGQKQRISIARALYRDPSFLILDEATSGLDALSEKKTLDALLWFNNKGMTIVIIAHKHSTLAYCDTILTLEGGRLCGEDPPAHSIPGSNQEAG